MESEDCRRETGCRMRRILTVIAMWLLGQEIQFANAQAEAFHAEMSDLRSRTAMAEKRAEYLDERLKDAEFRATFFREKMADLEYQVQTHLDFGEDDPSTALRELKQALERWRAK